MILELICKEIRLSGPLTGRSITHAFYLPVCCVWHSGLYMQAQEGGILDCMSRFLFFFLGASLTPASFLLFFFFFFSPHVRMES